MNEYQLILLLGSKETLTSHEQKLYEKLCLYCATMVAFTNATAQASLIEAEGSINGKCRETNGVYT